MTPTRWASGALLCVGLSLALTPLLWPAPATIGDPPSPATSVRGEGFGGGKASSEAGALELSFDDDEELEGDDLREDGEDDPGGDVLPVYLAQPAAAEAPGQVAPVQSSAPALPGGCTACSLEAGHPGWVSEEPVAPPPPMRRRWLIRHQNEDGNWSSDSWRLCGVCCAGPGHDPGQRAFDVAVTGAVLLAFVGEGHTHRFGSFKWHVSKALKWLRAQQAPWGQFGHGSGPEAWRDHLLAAFALSDLLACSRDFALRRAVGRALDYALEEILPGLEETGDPRLIGWLILFCRAVKGGSSLEIPGEVWPRLRRLARQDSTDPVVASVGILGHMLSGQLATSVTRRAAERLAAAPPRWESEQVDLERWYFTTYALYVTGGAPWATWRKALTGALLPAQRVGGCQDGSWDPIGAAGRRGGRVHTTALASLLLQIYYRYERSKGG